MNPKNVDSPRLSKTANSRDPGHTLESSLRRIVRRVVRRGHADSDLAKRILMVADDVPRESCIDSQLGQDQLINLVSRRICDQMTTERSAASVLGMRLMDTLRCPRTEAVRCC